MELVVLQLRNQAIENVSNKRKLSDGQIERTWHQYVFDVEFARLVLENADKLKGEQNV